MDKQKPIKSQKEAEKVFKTLSKIAVDTLGISEEQAGKRIQCLLDSGSLNGLKEGSTEFMITTELYMTTPR